MIRNQIQRVLCVTTCILIGLLAGVPVVGADAPPLSTPRSAVTGSQTFLPFIVKSENPTPPPSGCTSPISTGAEWPMLAANPQRTSWTPEEVRCNLGVTWYRPIEPFIPYKVQPIAANGKIYVSTARGLYAINANSGNVDWVYPTELPLGHSPTVSTVNGKSTIYVGGYDHKIHAIDATAGTDIAGYTPYEAIAGFETNPLVVQDSSTNNTPTTLAGNRDGYFYALNATNGSLVWKYQTGGPILYSAAYKNGVVYFASNDMYAYALNVSNGSLVWKSGKFPGQGFFSYWPIIYTNKSTGKDYVIFNGGENYRQSEFWLPTSENSQGETSIFRSYGLPNGRLPQTSSPVSGDWMPGTVTMDASIILDYYTKYPYRRSDYVLDAASGQEYTFTYNGKQTYAPFNYSGVTRGGSKYPPIVNGVDGVLYQQTAYADFNSWISTGAPVGWKFGTPFISQISEGQNPETTATDEPTAFSSGGKLIYNLLTPENRAWAFDITIPYGQPNRSWGYWGYNLSNLAPNYDRMYYQPTGFGKYVYGSNNGIYSKSGQSQSPLVPYQGKLFLLKVNALIALSPTGGSNQLPLATAVTTQSSPTPPTRAQLVQRLETEVQKMLSAGHLRPGYSPAGFFDQNGEGLHSDDQEFGEIFDYFQNPADTIYTLLLAYPYLSSATQSQVISYLKNNYGPGAPYDFTKIVHIGWGTGAKREFSDIPPEDFAVFGTPYMPPLNPSTRPTCAGGNGSVCGYWTSYPPFSFYAAWKYAQIVGNNDQTFANNIFSLMSNKIEAPPTNTTFLIHKPYFIHLYAAGYYGYLQLKQLAGLGGDPTIQNYYNQMLSFRVGNFSKDTYWTGFDYNFALNVARNFMFLTPEIGDYLSKNVLSQAQGAVNEYNYIAPYWFVSRFDQDYGEGTLEHLYDPPAMFQAKAYILKQPYTELVKWLDVPAFAQGDLFYIQDLAAALSAP